MGASSPVASPPAGAPGRAGASAVLARLASVHGELSLVGDSVGQRGPAEVPALAAGSRTGLVHAHHLIGAPPPPVEVHDPVGPPRVLRDG